MTTFVLWAVFIAFLVLVVFASLTRAVVRRLRGEPQGPYRHPPRE